MSPTPQFILTVKFSDFEKSRFPFICWAKSNQLVALRAKTEGWKVGGKTKREGRYVCQWLIHVSVWRKPTQHCKAIILQLKIHKFFLKKERKD